MDTSTSKNITRHRLKARTRQRSMTRPPFKNDSVKNSYWDKVGIEPDIQGLFNEFNSEYFYGKLPQVNLKWTYRISTAAGLCWPDGNGNYIVRLNKPLLEQRPRRNTAEILLHEMIHVYQFVTCARDLDHGASFQYHCRRIKKLTGVKITTYHQFHKEYDELKRHWWICQGPCGELVKRTMNRPPCTKAHKRKCGGDFVKIQEPNESPYKDCCHASAEHNKAKLFPLPVGLSSKQCCLQFRPLIIEFIIANWEGYALHGKRIFTPPIVYSESTGDILSTRTGSL